MKVLSTLRLLIIFINLSGCTLGYRNPSFHELLKFEEKLVTTSVNYNVKSKEINKALNVALESNNLPSDYAQIVLIDTQCAVMSSGLSREIYVSNVFVELIKNNIFEQFEISLFLMHELAHKDLDHTYQLLVKPKIVVGYQDLEINDVFKMAYILGYMAIFKMPSTASLQSNVLGYYGLSQAINGGNVDMELKKSIDIVESGFLGYPYTDEMEFSADEIVIDYLKNNAIDVNKYSIALRKLKGIYEKWCPELNNSIATRIQDRLDYIQRNL